jgi:hypothetical protein
VLEQKKKSLLEAYPTFHDIFQNTILIILSEKVSNDRYIRRTVPSVIDVVTMSEFNTIKCRLKRRYVILGSQPLEKKMCC